MYLNFLRCRENVGKERASNRQYTWILALEHLLLYSAENVIDLFWYQIHVITELHVGSTHLNAATQAIYRITSSR